MHRPLKFATLIAVALAFTACADLPRGITEPDGLRMTHSELSSALDVVYHKAEAVLNDLYACAPDKQEQNKNKNLNDVRIAAKAGKWDQVVSGVNKIIKDTDELIAKTKEGIPSTCPGSYDNAAERAALRDEMVFWLNYFANQGSELTHGDIAAVLCPTGANCTETGAGWKIDIPNGAFDQDVIVIVQPNDGQFPHPEDYNPVGKSWHFDVVPAIDANEDYPWTRWICVNEEGLNEDDDPVSWIVMVRETAEGLDFLETTAAFWENPYDCTPLPDNGPITSRILRGAKGLLAGFPLFPRDLHAYSPPRTFGGTSTASSPHWLLQIPPAEGQFTLQGLYDLAEEYYGDATPNTTASLGHVQTAIDCDVEKEGDGYADCVNSALNAFTKTVAAQTGPNKVLTQQEGEELISIALALML